MKWVALILVLVLISVGVIAEPIKDKGNIGLYDLGLDRIVIDGDELNPNDKVELEPTSNGLYKVTTTTGLGSVTSYGVDLKTTSKTDKMTFFGGTVQVYKDNEPIDLIVTPEITKAIRYNSFRGWEYNHEVTITNKGKGDLFLNKNNFSAKGIVYELLYRTNVDYLNTIDVNEKGKVSSKQVLQTYNMLMPITTANIRVKSGETLQVYYKYFSRATTGKWDFILNYEGQKYVIDPYWSAGVGTSDLNHNMNKTGYVKQWSPNASWTVGGELDWNTLKSYPSAYDPNLVLYYKLDYNNGFVVYDETGNYDGNLVGTGYIGGGGVYDSNAFFGNATATSIDANACDKNVQTVILWANNVGYSNAIIGLSDTWRFVVNPNTQANITASSATLYINGLSTSLSSPIISGYAHYAVVLSGVYACNIQIGKIDTAVNIPKGNYDEVKLYDRKLSADEILEDYNAYRNSRFVNNNIINAGSSATFNSIKINSNTDYNFGKEYMGNPSLDTNLSLLLHLNNNVLDSSDYNNDVDLNVLADNSYSSALWDTNGFVLDLTNKLDINTQGTGLNPRENFGMSFWFKPSVFRNGSLVARPYAQGVGARSMNLTIGGSALILALWTNANAGVTTTFNDLRLDKLEWYHVVVTQQGTEVKAYLNGKKSAVVGIRPADIKSLTTAMTINGSGNALGNKLLGTIEEFMFWDRGLSDEEAKQLYLSQAGKFDLNIYTCSDSACVNKTDSLYLEDLDNNAWVSLSGLDNAQYLGFDGFYKTIMEISDYNNGYYTLFPFLHDVNIEYTAGGETCVWSYNVDWNISTSITCTDKNIDLGTGRLVIKTGGFLELIDSNVYSFKTILEGVGDLIKLTGSWIRIG